MDGMQSVIILRYVASICSPWKVFHASQMPAVGKPPRGLKVTCRRVNDRISLARIPGSQLSSGLCARIVSKFGTGLGGGWNAQSVLAVGPTNWTKLVEVAIAMTFNLSFWVRCS